MICLGIESTAHTFGIGIVEDGEILANEKDMFVPEKGGINPLDAKNHHEKVKQKVLEDALAKARITKKDIDLVAYAAGPGLPPCLKVGALFAKELGKNKKVIEVNHAVAHIEIGRHVCGILDPIVVYVSGGNTQIIGYAAGRYRVFGETQDIPIGNAIDVFIRETYGKDKKAETFGGPILERLATGKYLELPYVVKGMDLSFTGITTAAINKFRKGEKIEDLCFSFQETCFAMLTEVTERALAHTGKKDVLLVGGVAASKAFRQMIEVMCDERGAKAFTVPPELAGDQGAMIAWNGVLAHINGQKGTRKADFNPLWRVDQVDVKWM